VTIDIIFETHSTTEDNERGLATGWNGGRLSLDGRGQAAKLGLRRRGDGLSAVFASDLQRAQETVEIAFEGSTLPVLFDWRLRECDYGELNGAPVAQVHATRLDHLRRPYPKGESWTQAVQRVKWFLDDLPLRCQGQRLLVVGHLATLWGLEHWINGLALEGLATSEFVWQDGWRYRI
jgi:2,3-bisphosphoglycerate-dependent phosphoglycerate mutase